MLGNKPIYGLDSHLKPTCQAAAHPLSTLQSLGNISNQPALQPQEANLHTPSGHIVAPKSGLFACHHASKADNTSQKRHLKPIHRWCSGTNQSTAWIATWNQPARLPHIPCRPCKALGTSQTNLLCSRKKQQHEPSHPQWTCCSPQKRTVCVPPWSKADNTSQKRHLKPIHRWCSGTNQSTAWIATWNQPARLPHIPCRPCKALGTSQTNLLCSRKKQQHEPSHPQWTCCSPQKRTVCVPPCIKSRQYPKHFLTSPLGQDHAGSLLLNFKGQ